MKLPRLGWFLSAPAAIVYSSATENLQEIMASPGKSAEWAALVARVLFTASIASWVLADARRRQQTLPYGFGLFLYIAWPVMVPFYLVTSRGWRGLWVVLGYFTLLYFAGVLLSLLLRWVVLHR